MANNKGTVIKNKTSVYAGGRLWSKESFKAYRQYQAEYNKEHYRQVNFRLSLERDQELLEWLQSQSNLAGYMKQLVQEDMERKKSQQK